jgi:peroxiredoxin Q/BCP
VVLYFFPAAYTSGCTAEAHEFAEATPEFEKLGATVIGVTGGNVDRSRTSPRSTAATSSPWPPRHGDLIKKYDVDDGGG